MKTTSPFEYAEVINVLVEGLHLDLFTKEEVTQWADGFILRDEQPDIFFIELSLSQNANDALAILGQTVRLMAAETTPRPLLGALYKKLIAAEKPLTKVAEELWASDWNGLLTKAEIFYMNNLSYAVELLDVECGITYQQLQQDNVDFLSLYEEYTIENYSRWDTLDQTITQQLSTITLPEEFVVKPEEKVTTVVKRLWWQFWKS